MSHWFALLLVILANVGGNLALKQFSAFTPERLDGAGIIATLLQPWLWVGAAMAGLLFVAYIWALRGIPLSIAYPLATGLSAVGISCAAGLLFGEAVGVTKIAGVGLVVAGVLLITQ